MKATDLDLEITEATPATVEQAGATTVPAHLLYDIVRKLPDGSEVLLATGTSRQLDVGHFRPLELLAAMPAAVRLPAIYRRLPSPYVRLKATDLKRLIDAPSSRSRPRKRATI